jgi:hypothetical protein
VLQNTCPLQKTFMNLTPFRIPLRISSFFGFGVILATAPFTQAQTQNQLLVFTEYSDTMLTATLNGVAAGTVHYTGSPNRWQWDSGTPASFVGTGSDAWQEPANEPGINWLLPGRFGGDAGLDIISDTNVVFLAGAANGTTISSALTIRPVSGDTTTYDIKFLDLGDNASVSDSASTLRLVMISAFGLFGMSRLPCAKARAAAPRI